MNTLQAADAPPAAQAGVITIRAYRPEDYAAARSLWEETRMRPHTPLELERLIASGGGALVAVCTQTDASAEGHLEDRNSAANESVVGVALWSHNGSLGMLWRLAVTESMRGRGIATLLIDRVEADVRAAGMDGIALLTRAANTVARDMYARRGYKWNEPLEFWGKKLPAPASEEAGPC